MDAADASILSRHLHHLELKGQSARSIYARKRSIIRLAGFLAPITVASASIADLGRWRESLGVGDHAIVTYACHIRELYAWCVAEGLRADNPAAALPLPRAPKGIPRPIAEEELMTAVDHASARVRPWLVLAGWAGLRACEISGLRRECVLETAQPPVLLIAEDATKGRRERLVPMSAFVLAELQLAGLPAVGFVFRRHDGGSGPNAPWLISHLANECLHSSGSTATLHKLRHRFLTMCYRESHDLRLVQELAGHSSPSTTAGYAAYDRGAAVAAVESLPVPTRLRAVS